MFRPYHTFLWYTYGTTHSPKALGNDMAPIMNFVHKEGGEIEHYKAWVLGAIAPTVVRHALPSCRPVG
jgi:hypothetical protein